MASFMLSIHLLCPTMFLGFLREFPSLRPIDVPLPRESFALEDSELISVVRTGKHWLNNLDSRICSFRSCSLAPKH